MNHLPAIFSLLVAAAGWYYLFYSKAAHRLHGIEDERLNRLRVRLRRTCGLVIICLAVAMYAMLSALEHERYTEGGWWLLAVMALLLASVLLALIDIRLTARMRRERESRRHP